MNQIIINSNENYLHIDNNVTNNPIASAHMIEHEESVDIMKVWYEGKDDNTGENEKFNVVNVFLGRSNAATKTSVNQIIRKLCTDDLEKICSLEYDALSLNEGSIER